MNQNFPREGNIAFFDGMSEGLDDRTVVQFLSKLNHLKFEGRSTEKGAGFWWCMHFSEQFVDYPVSQFGCIHRPFLMVSTPIITSFRLNSTLVFSSLHAIHQSSFAGCLLSNRWLLHQVHRAQEQITDLLEPSASNLQIREDQRSEAVGFVFSPAHSCSPKQPRCLAFLSRSKDEPILVIQTAMEGATGY